MPQETENAGLPMPGESLNETVASSNYSSSPLFAELLETLGYKSGEHLAICNDDGEFSSEVIEYRAGCIDMFPTAVNVWFGVNPTRGPARVNTGRGDSDAVTRLAALWCDLDVKPGACRDLEHGHRIIDTLSELLGTRPSAVVHSGHGLQPYWPIDGYYCAAGSALRAEAKTLLRRWRRLVELVAESHDAKVDNVYDLARVLRVPGTVNHKGEPVPVTYTADTGGPLTVDEIRERLDEAGIDEQPTSDDRADMVSPPVEWTYADAVCGYAHTMINGWATDNPTARHTWFLSQNVRLAAAHRNGCLTEAAHRKAAVGLEQRFLALLARPGDTRAVKRFEVAELRKEGVLRAARKNDDQLAKELGQHLHLDQLAGTASTNSVCEVFEVCEPLDTPSSEKCSSDEDSHTSHTSHTPTNPLADLVSGAWLDGETFDPIEYIVDGILTAGLGILAGAPKAGKSWLALAVALAVAAGGAVLGSIAVKARPVLYLALEDSHRRLQNRARAVLGRGVKIPPNLYFSIQATHEQALAKIAAFLQRHASEQPLVIVDTFGKVKPPKGANQDSYQADYDAAGGFKKLVDEVDGAGILLVHHTRKLESGDFVDAVSGTFGIAGAADYVAVLKRKRKSPEATLSITGRDVTENEYALISAPDTDGIVWHLDGDNLEAAAAKAEARSDTGDLGEKMRAVLDAVNTTDGNVTPAGMAKRLDMDNNDVGEYLRRLAAKGLVTRAARGQYLRLVIPDQMSFLDIDTDTAA